MNADTLLEHFERISEAPDAVAQLRRFILDLAVCGKLVSQDPNEEPASELLNRIQHLKAQRVKDKKYDGMVDAHEIPFEIPSGWTWARVGDLCSKTGSWSTPRHGALHKVERKPMWFLAFRCFGLRTSIMMV
jgi:type I restriction enzyme, S subunit